MPTVEELKRAYDVAGEGGKWFSVEFVKKNGDRRRMICRTGVTSRLKGGTLKYDPKKYDLMTVFDSEKDDYRMVPLDPERVIAVKGRGEVIYHNEGAENYEPH